MPDNRESRFSSQPSPDGSMSTLIMMVEGMSPARQLAAKFFCSEVVSSLYPSDNQSPDSSRLHKLVSIGEKLPPDAKDSIRDLFRHLSEEMSVLWG